jgi:hypothetical protein
MKTLGKNFTTTSLLLLLLSLSTFSFANDPAAIMEKVDRMQRDTNDNSFTKNRLSTCKYALQNNSPVCTEKPRLKVIETIQKYYGPDKKDGKSISIVLEPASEKGIGMLTYSYDDDAKDTESWLYLSALGKVKRMVSGGKEEQEPVAFFGSEFTTEDMENGKTDEYTHRIAQEGKYGAYDVWVIEAIPNEQRLKTANHSLGLIKKKWWY